MAYQERPGVWYVYRRHPDGKTEWMKSDLIGVPPEWVDTKEDATRFTSKAMATYAIGETGEPGLEVEQAA